MPMDAKVRLAKKNAVDFIFSGNFGNKRKWVLGKVRG